MDCAHAWHASHINPKIWKCRRLVSGIQHCRTLSRTLARSIQGGARRDRICPPPNPPARSARRGVTRLRPLRLRLLCGLMIAPRRGLAWSGLWRASACLRKTQHTKYTKYIKYTKYMKHTKYELWNLYIYNEIKFLKCLKFVEFRVFSNYSNCLDFLEMYLCIVGVFCILFFFMC